MPYEPQAENLGAMVLQGAAGMSALLNDAENRRAIRMQALGQYGGVENQPTTFSFKGGIEAPGQAGGLRQPASAGLWEAPATPPPTKLEGVPAWLKPSAPVAPPASAQLPDLSTPPVMPASEEMPVGQPEGQVPAEQAFQPVSPDLRATVERFSSAVRNHPGGALTMANAREDLARAGVLQDRNDPLFDKMVLTPGRLSDDEVRRFEGLEYTLPAAQTGSMLASTLLNKELASRVFPEAGMQGVRPDIGPLPLEGEALNEQIRNYGKNALLYETAEMKAKKATSGRPPVEQKGVLDDVLKRFGAQAKDFTTNMLDPMQKKMYASQTNVASLIDTATTPAEFDRYKQMPVWGMSTTGQVVQAPAYQVIPSWNVPGEVGVRLSRAWKNRAVGYGSAPSTAPAGTSGVPEPLPTTGAPQPARGAQVAPQRQPPAWLASLPPDKRDGVWKLMLQKNMTDAQGLAAAKAKWPTAFR